MSINQRISRHHTLHHETHFQGFKINRNYGPLLTDILESFRRVMDNACDEYPRVYAQRIDLHLPSNFDGNDTKVISRFIDSMKAKIEADHVRTAKELRRIYPCHLRYHWVRESGGQGPYHYHVTLFMNKDWRYTLGNFDAPDSLAGMIHSAWSSALRMDVSVNQGLVHFCKHGNYIVDRNSGLDAWQKEKLFERASYGAKADYKDHGDGKHIYGYSRD